MSSFMKELSELCVWDPAEEGLAPHVEINRTKINHLTKRYLLSYQPDEDWQEAYGLSAYQLAKNHMTATNMLFLTSRITMKSYTDCIEPLGSGDQSVYNPPTDDAEQFLKDIRELCSDLEVYRTSVHEVTIEGDTVHFPSDPNAIDALLTSMSLPSLESFFKDIVDKTERLTDLEASLKKTRKDKEELESKVGDLAVRVEAGGSLTDKTFEANEELDIPEGRIVMRKASDLFEGVTFERDLEVPSWEWGPEGDPKVHPLVPVVDSGYIFRPKQLLRVLYAIVTNQRAYLQGHTGSGKTTLIEQVAAHLNWPFYRINFDSEITRMDLIGRDTLKTSETGQVVSAFEDGMLPTAMASPSICCFDELDFVRPDVAYVMQAALEGNGLRITEDGDRLVKPHPMFRMFGTGNTVGQGDEHGMYQGARPQSIAFLDRFTIWLKVEYLTPDEREALVKDKYPTLDDAARKGILQYTTEHLEAFSQGKVIQPISPRGILAVCRAAIILGSVKEALEMTVLDRSNVEDRATLKGLVDRVSR